MVRTVRILLGFLIVAWIIAWIIAAPPCLGGNRATVSVSGYVVPYIAHSVVYQEAGIQVTEEDLRRGYVEVPSGTVIEVRTNDRKGYFLLFEGMEDLFREIWVMEGERTIVLSSGGGLVAERPRGGGQEIKTLSYRMFLKKNTLPGFYPWPLYLRACLL